MNYPNVKLVMKSTSLNNESISTTIGYVNPNADNGLLKEFAQKLNDFTTNTFTEITKVTTDDISNEEYYPYSLEVDPTEIIFTDTEAVTVTITLPDSMPDDIVTAGGVTIGSTGGYTRGGTQGAGTRNISFTLKANTSSAEKSATVKFTIEDGEDSTQLTPTYYIHLVPNLS